MATSLSEPASTRARSVRTSFKGVFGGRRVSWWIALFAMTLGLPTLRSGLATDDFVHRALARVPGRCLDVFSFVDASWAERAKELGLLPWYTPAGFRLSFWRPLASLTHCVDSRFFPDAVAWMHVENLLWFGASIVAVGALYRRLMSSVWAAGLATWFYAVDDAHGPAVGWLASRNGLMASCFGALALCAHDRYGHERLIGRRVRGPVVFACALLSAEAGVQTLGYLVAYVACDRRSKQAARWAALAPYVLVTAAWAGAYRALGHGVRGSSLYVDPLRSTRAFAHEAVLRLPTLLASVWGGRSANAVSVLSLDRQSEWSVIAVALLAGLALVLEPFLRSVPRAGFWALGSGLSAVAACAGPLSDRALAQVALGVMALAAEAVVVVATAAHARWSWSFGPAALVATMLAVRHGVVAPPLLASRMLEVKRTGEKVEHQREALEEAGRGGRMVVVVRGPDLFQCTLARVLASLSMGRPPPGLCLAGGPSAAIVQRVDAYTLRIQPEGGFIDAPGNRLCYGPSQAFSAGESETLGEMAVTVERITPNGEPADATFRFSHALDDPAFVWLVWTHGDYVGVTLPAAGASLSLEAIDAEILP